MATGDQLHLERLAMDLVETPELQAEADRLRDYYRTQAVASTASGAATLDAAVDSVVMGAAQKAVLLDAERPRFMWTANAEHEWFDLTVPRSGYGIENPDNVYRQVAVDGSSSYRIAGRFADQLPKDFSLVLYAEVPGTGPMTQEGSPIQGVLTLSELQVADDGTFTVTVGPSPAEGRVNHIQTQPDSRVLIVRDSLADWSAELPAELTITREGREAGPERPFADVVSDGAKLAATIGRYWVDWNEAFIYPRPVNDLLPARGRMIGFATGGHFDLREDEVLVVTVDPKDAGYLGFQLADPWGVALEYVHRTGSLNQSQVVPNPDGTVTYVISASDPGVWNWLDTSGLTSAIMVIRWQAVPPSAGGPDGAVRSVQRAPLSDLARVLPAGTTFVDSRHRQEQLDARRGDYERRLLST